MSAATFLALALAGCAAPGLPGQAGTDASIGAPAAGSSVPAVFTVGGNVTLRRAAPARHPRYPDLPAIGS
ncbi:MAG TPA: hypothetical protein DDX04_03885, partial [Massilia sp.]|nr:hypothetical protein [Massilia sp.]